MRYLNRDQSGKVIGHHANREAYATELVSDDHLDLVEFIAARNRKPTDLERASKILATDPAMRGLIKVLAARFGLTPEKVIEAIKQQV